MFLERGLPSVTDTLLCAKRGPRYPKNNSRPTSHNLIPIALFWLLITPPLLSITIRLSLNDKQLLTLFMSLDHRFKGNSVGVPVVPKSLAFCFPLSPELSLFNGDAGVERVATDDGRCFSFAGLFVSDSLVTCQSATDTEQH